MMDKEQIITVLRDALKNEPAVVFGYLFGSCAHGNTMRESDVDVAIYLLPEMRERFFDLRLIFMGKLSRALSREADVIILNTAAPFLKYSILKEGILVYRRDEKQQVEFELKALNEYFDYQPTIELYRERLRAS